MQKKRKGFLLIEGILQIVVLGLVAVGFAALFSSQFTTLSASKTAVEARQMAELEAAYIRKIGYNDFNSADATGVDDNGFHKNGIHDKEIMTKFAGTTSEGGMGDKWYSKVSIVGVSGVGDGATVTKVNGEDGNNLKIARIEIYRAKDGTPNAAAENTSRYSLEVPLSSQNGGVYVAVEDFDKTDSYSTSRYSPWSDGDLNWTMPFSGYLYFISVNRAIYSVKFDGIEIKDKYNIRAFGEVVGGGTTSGPIFVQKGTKISCHYYDGHLTIRAYGIKFIRVKNAKIVG